MAPCTHMLARQTVSSILRTKGRSSINRADEESPQDTDYFISLHKNKKKKIREGRILFSFLFRWYAPKQLLVCETGEFPGEGGTELPEEGQRKLPYFILFGLLIM